MEKKTILLVDDDKEFLFELDEMLTANGYRTIAVDDGLKALVEARKARPDLIVMDIKMGGLNGFQVADRLSHGEGTSDIPIIAMSAHFAGPSFSKVTEMTGIRAMIRKPFAPITVIENIEKFLEEAEKGRERVPAKKKSGVKNADERRG